MLFIIDIIIIITILKYSLMKRLILIYRKVDNLATIL